MSKPEGRRSSAKLRRVVGWEVSVPLLVVSRNLGHRDGRMVELHYGHLASSYVADAIRNGAPKFGVKPDEKITTLGGRDCDPSHG